MGRYGVRITKNKQGEHVFRAHRVIQSLSGFPTPVMVASSASVGVHSLPSEWFRKEEIVAHKIRAKKGGLKGRILYVLANEIPLAFMSIHRPQTGPLTGETIVASNVLAASNRRRMIQVMIECATEISEASKRSKGMLGWTTNSDYARDMLIEFGFVRSRKPKWCDRKHYLLRTANN